jgi:hypothetical protein
MHEDIHMYIHLQLCLQNTYAHAYVHAHMQAYAVPSLTLLTDYLPHVSSTQAHVDTRAHLCTDDLFGITYMHMYICVHVHIHRNAAMVALTQCRPGVLPDLPQHLHSRRTHSDWYARRHHLSSIGSLRCAGLLFAVPVGSCMHTHVWYRQYAHACLV